LRFETRRGIDDESNLWIRRDGRTFSDAGAAAEGATRATGAAGAASGVGFIHSGDAAASAGTAAGAGGAAGVGTSAGAGGAAGGGTAAAGGGTAASGAGGAAGGGAAACGGGAGGGAGGAAAWGGGAGGAAGGAAACGGGVGAAAGGGVSTTVATDSSAPDNIASFSFLSASIAALMAASSSSRSPARTTRPRCARAVRAGRRAAARCFFPDLEATRDAGATSAARAESEADMAKVILSILYGRPFRRSIRRVRCEVTLTRGARGSRVCIERESPAKNPVRCAATVRIARRRLGGARGHGQIFSRCFSGCLPSSNLGATI